MSSRWTPCDSIFRLLLAKLLPHLSQYRLLSLERNPILKKRQRSMSVLYVRGLPRTSRSFWNGKGGERGLNYASVLNTLIRQSSSSPYRKFNSQHTVTVFNMAFSDTSRFVYHSSSIFGKSRIRLPTRKTVFMTGNSVFSSAVPEMLTDPQTFPSSVLYNLSTTINLPFDNTYKKTSYQPFIWRAAILFTRYSTGTFIGQFFILRKNETLISSIEVLPSGCDVWL